MEQTPSRVHLRRFAQQRTFGRTAHHCPGIRVGEHMATWSSLSFGCTGTLMRRRIAARGSPRLRSTQRCRCTASRSPAAKPSARRPAATARTARGELRASELLVADGEERPLANLRRQALQQFR